MWTNLNTPALAGALWIGAAGFGLAAVLALVATQPRRGALAGPALLLGAAGAGVLLSVFGVDHLPDAGSGTRRTLAMRLIACLAGIGVASALCAIVFGRLERRASMRAANSGGTPEAGAGAALLRIFVLGVGAMAIGIGTLGTSTAATGVGGVQAAGCALLGASAAWITGMLGSAARAGAWAGGWASVLVWTAAIAGSFFLLGGVNHPLLGALGIVLSGIGALALVNPSQGGVSPGPARAHAGIFACACICIGALFAAPMVAREGLSHRAESYVRAMGRAPDLSPLAAVVVANETFAVVLPGLGKDGQDVIRAGVLLDRSQFETRDEVTHLEPGLAVPAEPLEGDLDAHGFRLKGRTPHGDHFHDFDFRIVNVSKASLRELCSAMDAVGASPGLVVGLLIGAACAAGASLAARAVLALALAVAGLALGPAACLGAIAGVIGAGVLRSSERSGDPPLAWMSMLAWSGAAVALSPVAARFMLVHVWL